MPPKIKSVVFYGGPLHEHSINVALVEGVLPILEIHTLNSSSQLYIKYHQRYVHYQLAQRKIGKGKNSSVSSIYRLIGYSKDRGKLSVFPTA
jgi:hypothetical protein